LENISLVRLCTIIIMTQNLKKIGMAGLAEDTFDYIYIYSIQVKNSTQRPTYTLGYCIIMRIMYNSYADYIYIYIYNKQITFFLSHCSVLHY